MLVGPVPSIATSHGVVIAYRDFSRSWIACLDPRTGHARWRTFLPDLAVVGRMRASASLLCVPVDRGAIVVLDARTGTLRKRLDIGNGSYGEALCCTPTRIVAANNSAKWTEEVIGVDARSFHRAWTREFPRTYIWEITATEDSFRLLGSDPFGMGGLADRQRPPANFRAIAVSASDGRVLSITRVTNPALLRAVPPTVPPAPRRWIAQHLDFTESGITSHFWERTSIECLEDLVFVGRRGPGTVGELYALRAADAGVAWQRTVPGLDHIVLSTPVLLVGSTGLEGPTYRTWTRYTGYGARTGRQLWTFRPSLTPPRSRGM